MKTKKVLSVILALCMVFSVLSISVSAAPGKTYTASGSYVVTDEYSFDAESFKLSATVNPNTIYVLDGCSPEYTYDVTSFRAVYVNKDKVSVIADYVVDPDAFFAVFAERDSDAEFIEEYNKDKEEEYKMKLNNITLVAEFSISFADDGVFGELSYDFVIEGFSAPATSGLDIGIDIGDIADAVKLPVDLTISGKITGFPSIQSATVVSRPVKTAYTDADRFDITGLQVAIETTDGVMGTYTYSDDTAYAFTTNPSNKENLSIYDSEVVTYLNGLEIVKTPITVDHCWSDGFVCITTDKYSTNKPGYHAIVCEGCGETHSAEPHVIDDAAWTYNNDQTFMKDGTESNVCLECGATLIRDTHGTADYHTVLADYHFIRVILDYVNTLLHLIDGAIK
ncbi:MAG: hypothetical protein ACI4VW_01930 [Acutalibacteraceae bacterium]